jgi:hypothetical protein
MALLGEFSVEFKNLERSPLKNWAKLGTRTKIFSTYSSEGWPFVFGRLGGWKKYEKKYEVSLMC